jgi:hypothetical protein
MIQQTLTKRPKVISTICIIGFVWIVFSFPAVFSPSVKKMGDWFPALYGFFVALNFIAFIGIWYLKKWGISLFTIVFFIKTFFQLVYNDYAIVGTILSVLFIILLIPFYKKMNSNL